MDEVSKGIKDIGNALSLDFANRISENKDEINRLKIGAKKEELTDKECIEILEKMIIKNTQ